MSRWLKLIVAVAAVWLCMATTTASAATFAYDVPTIARVHVHPVGGDDVAETEFTAARGGSGAPAFDARGTSTTLVSRSVATEAEGPALESAFHHTTSGAVDSIMETGLRPGAYATPTEGLSPLQAHIELALNPAGGARNALLQVDLAGLRAAGYEIPGITRVTGAFGMAGGGYEMQFLYAVPSEFLKVIWP